MNPVILVPTYWSGSRVRDNGDIITTYDHMTAIGQKGELPRLLESMRKHGITTPIFLLVVATEGNERDAEAKVRRVAAEYPELNLRVFGIEELEVFNTRIRQMGLSAISSGVGLAGYSAMRNFGLCLTAAAGFDAAIFIDDDEIIDTPDFVQNACYGLGKLSRSGVPIFVKTGYFVNGDGSVGFADKKHWYDRFWKSEESYNEWINGALAGARLSRSRGAFGGCLAIHREAFRRVSFDPLIPRGEDMDYLLNIYMYGSDVWFDNKWSIIHKPPTRNAGTLSRFKQDIYRWFYEVRKVEFSKTQIDLRQLKPESLGSYPGNYLVPSVKRRITLTALLRSIGAKGERKSYMSVTRQTRKDALAYAEKERSRYFDFQYFWPEAVSLIEQDVSLKKLLGLV